LINTIFLNLFNYILLGIWEKWLSTSKIFK